MSKRQAKELSTMRPILLKGHERSITHIKYNNDGDLLFSSSKHNFPCVWNAQTGERIGTYDGHNGAVWYLDVNDASTRLLTASADADVKLWDVESGRQLYSFTHKVPVRCVNFAEGERRFLSVTDQVMNSSPTILLFELTPHIEEQNPRPLGEIVGTSRINQAHWGVFNDRIYACAQDGSVKVYDTETSKVVGEINDHKQACMSINFDKEKVFFVTASKDGTARLYDAKSLTHVKTYDTGRPLNSAAISPLKPHVIVGGGQAAHTVTTTRVDSSQFRVKFFHQIYADELWSVAGHFGPVNVLSFSPDGKSFATGAEDGYVRIQHFDQLYLQDRI